MIMTYRAIYKCRLCGEVFCQGENHTENESLNKIVKLSTVFPFFHMTKDTYHMVAKMEVLDFQNFLDSERLMNESYHK